MGEGKMSWKEFFRPTIGKISVALVLFLVLPTIMKICDIEHGFCVWVIEWFFGIQILPAISSISLWDARACIYLILQIVLSYLISCIILYFATRNNKLKSKKKKEHKK